MSAAGLSFAQAANGESARQFLAFCAFDSYFYEPGPHATKWPSITHLQAVYKLMGMFDSQGQ